MEGRTIIYYLNRFKHYILIIAFIFALLVLLIFNSASTNLSSIFNIIVETISTNLVNIFIITIVVAIVLWFIFRILSKLTFNKLQKDREEMKEKSKIRELQNSAFRGQ